MPLRPLSLHIDAILFFPSVDVCQSIIFIREQSARYEFKKNQSYEVDAFQTPCSLTTAVNHSRLHLFRKYFSRGMVLISMVDTVMRQLLLAARLRGSAMDSDQRALKHRVMFPVTTPQLS